MRTRCLSLTSSKFVVKMIPILTMRALYSDLPWFSLLAICRSMLKPWIRVISPRQQNFADPSLESIQIIHRQLNFCKCKILFYGWIKNGMKPFKLSKNFSTLPKLFGKKLKKKGRGAKCLIFIWAEPNATIPFKIGLKEKLPSENC